MGRKVDWLKGIIVSLITPFDQNEEINEQALRMHIDFLIEKKINVLFPLSTTGEFFKQSMQERKKVMSIVVDQANGRIPVMPGCHAFSTKMSIELAKYAEDVGADGICLLPPYGMFPLADEALYNHYKDVNEATELPVSVYTEQNVTNDMPLDLLNRLADLPNIMGVKLSTTDMERFQLGVLNLSNRIAVCTGMEQVFVPALTFGGLGGYLGTANMVPEFWVKVYDLFMGGNLRDALELNKKFTFVVTPVVLKYGFSETIKEALNIRGMNMGQTRRPSTKGVMITPKEKEEIRKMLLDLGITLIE